MDAEQTDEARVGESVSQVKAAFCAAFVSLMVRWFLLCWAQVKGVFLSRTSAG